MIPHSSPQAPTSSRLSWLHLAFLALATCFLAGCATTGSSGTYTSTAYAPTNPSKVVVKVSLSTQMVYVEEGTKMLLATPTCVGREGFPTPKGNFTVIAKNATKRSSTYGYWTNGTDAHPGKSDASPGAGYHYVGYPLAFWIEFFPGYGFHEGPVWPQPRSHGCLHIHEAASAKLFELVHIGTPVLIQNTFAEDTTYGDKFKRPTDYADPDPAPALMISEGFFTKPRDTKLLTTPAPSGSFQPPAGA